MIRVEFISGGYGEVVNGILAVMVVVVYFIERKISWAAVEICGGTKGSITHTSIDFVTTLEKL